MKQLPGFFLLFIAFPGISQNLATNRQVPDEKAKTISDPKLIQKLANLTPCAGGNISIPAGISGNNYQWQVNSGSGFTNLSNGGIYSGANASTLHITGAPSSLYGNQYRCMADANYGPVYILKFVSVWTGAADFNWENSGNWNCNSVPDAYTDVIINSGIPVLNSNASVRTLALGNGSHVTIKTGANLTVVY